MARHNRQYDPVAASAQAALDATERGIRAANRNYSLPRPPKSSAAFNMARDGIDTVSAVSPFNLAFGGGGGGGGGGGAGGSAALPGPDLRKIDRQVGQVLPSQVPTPMDLLPSNMSPGGGGRPPRGGNGGNSGNGGNGGSASRTASSGGTQFNSM